MVFVSKANKVTVSETNKVAEGRIQRLGKITSHTLYDNGGLTVNEVVELNNQQSDSCETEETMRSVNLTIFYYFVSNK